MSQNKGTQIEHVIAYLQKRQAEGYTHVVMETPDGEYGSFICYDEASRKDEGVLCLGGTCTHCLTCEKLRPKTQTNNTEEGGD